MKNSAGRRPAEKKKFDLSTYSLHFPDKTGYFFQTRKCGHTGPNRPALKSSGTLVCQRRTMQTRSHRDPPPRQTISQFLAIHLPVVERQYPGLTARRRRGKDLDPLDSLQPGSHSADQMFLMTANSGDSFSAYESKPLRQSRDSRHVLRPGF